jgi:hypothetical protein
LTNELETKMIEGEEYRKLVHEMAMDRNLRIEEK